MTLRTLRSQTRKIEDFAKAALEVSERGLINEERFRRWFTAYIHQRHDELLERLVGDSDEMKFCRLLVSALALAKEDYDRRDPVTPSNVPPALSGSSSRKRQGDLETESTTGTGSHKSSNMNNTSDSAAKKRRYNASVEDAPESDEEDLSTGAQLDCAAQ